MTTVVRRITPDDWRSWREIRMRSVAESPEAFMASVRTISAEDDREERWRGRIGAAVACWVATDGDGPVAMVALDPASEGRLQLASMFVAPEARRHGLGAALVEAVVAEAAGRPLFLRVMDGNEAAMSVYRRGGFELVDRGCDADGCLVMDWRPAAPAPDLDDPLTEE